MPNGRGGADHAAWLPSAAIVLREAGDAPGRCGLRGEPRAVCPQPGDAFQLLKRFPAAAAARTSKLPCSILPQSCAPNYFRIPNSDFRTNSELRIPDSEFLFVFVRSSIPRRAPG